MFKILSNRSIQGLEAEVNKYEVQLLGSLAISNGHFYQAIIGEIKSTVEKKPTENLSKPKATAKKVPAKRKPKATTKKET